MTEINLPDMAAQGAAAMGAGIMGRLVWLSRQSNRRFGWNLLWELPVAVGLGMLGLSVGQHFSLGFWETHGVGFCLAYLGPAVVDEIVKRIVAAALPPPD